MFKKIEINIPFSEVLTQMTQYAKFMKDILSKKRKITEEGIVSLTTTYSAVIQNTLQEKMQDPGSFTIPCKLGMLIWEKHCVILELASTLCLCLLLKD